MNRQQIRLSIMEGKLKFHAHLKMEKKHKSGIFLSLRSLTDGYFVNNRVYVQRFKKQQPVVFFKEKHGLFLLHVLFKQKASAQIQRTIVCEQSREFETNK